MTGSGDYIYQLSGKVKAICRILREVDEGFEGTQKALAAHCGIPWNTLRSSCRRENYRMSLDQQSKLAEMTGFSLPAPAWIDPRFRNKEGHDDERRDTAAHFEEMLRDLLDPTPPMKLRLKPQPDGTKILDPEIVTFDVSDVQNGTHGGPRVFFESYFEPGVDIGTQDVYGFKRIRISFDLKGCEGAQGGELLGHVTGTSINGARLDFRGNRARPVWYLEIDEGVLEGPYITQEQPLFSLLGAKPSEVIEARMSVQLKDGIVVTRHEKCAGNRAQKAVLKRLTDMRLPEDPDRNGWLDLGIQTIKIVAEDP